LARKVNDEKLFCPIDGLVASEVGKWAKEKHKILSNYIDITYATRKKFLPSDEPSAGFKGGAIYIDLFCGPGRSKVKKIDEWIDGSAVTAWKESQKKNAQFSKVLIADLDAENLEACKSRLESLGANVIGFQGDAYDALIHFEQHIGLHSLNFCFIDPFNLKSLDFKIIEKLASYKRMDILIHLSKMDLQRNLQNNLNDIKSDFDNFIPGWRDKFDLNHNYHHIRQQVVDCWIEKISGLQIQVTNKADWRLITGPRNIPLYWLMLIAKNELANKFWKEICKSEQGGLF